MRLLLVALIIAPLTFVGCTDDQSTVGSNFVPDSERFQVKVDTSGVDAYTVTQDSILTNNFTAGPIGSMINPFLGRTSANIATELYSYYMDTALFRDYNVRSLDSVILFLNVTKNIGLKGKPVKVYLHELTKNLDTLKTYYSNSDVSNFNPEPMASFSLTKVEQKKVVLYPSENLLCRNLGNSLINTTRAEMEKASEFGKKFKGFYLRVDPSESGAFYKIDLSTVTSQILVKYHITQKKAGVMKTDSTSLPFYFFNKLGASHRFISIKKDDSFANTTLKPKNLDKPVLDNVVFSSSMGGAITFIDLKQLLDWKKKVFNDTSFIIHRAELVVEYEKTLETEMDRIPQKLGLFTRSSNGKYKPIWDLILESGAGNSGTYNGKFQKGRMHYSANITRHLQALLTKSDTLSRVYLIPLAGDQQPVNENTSFFEDYTYGVFKGTTNASPMKLIVTYSKLKK